MEKRLIVHENSYKGYSVASFIHQIRLKKIFKLLKNCACMKEGRIADFGCSNGFILKELQKKVFSIKNWEFFGFDCNSQLLELADDKKGGNIHFNYFNLNFDEPPSNQFDIVCCFETLEHVGNWKKAISTLVDSCKEGGKIIITIPNEKGMQGIVKCFSRDIFRKNAYKGLFNRRSDRLKYYWRLFSDNDISFIRTPAEGYGPHLGFEWKLILDHFLKTYVKKGVLKLNNFEGIMLKFNYIIIFEKISPLKEFKQRESINRV